MGKEPRSDDEMTATDGCADCAVALPVAEQQRRPLCQQHINDLEVAILRSHSKRVGNTPTHGEAFGAVGLRSGI